MTTILDITIDRQGTITDPRIAGALFGDYEAYQRNAPECRSYAEAVAAYAAAVRPAAVSKAVRAARACGHHFLNAAAVRESAAETLRERLLGLAGFDEADVQWHIANPGQAMPRMYL